MANEFIARKGLIALEDSQITGSLSISQNLNVIGGLTASFDSSTSTAISGAFTSVSSSIASERLKNTTDTLTGDLTVTGTITAQEFHTEFVSASITYESGSHKFGDSYDDVHEFTGSVYISNSTGGTTGSLAFYGGGLTLSGDDADFNLNITSGSSIANLTEFRFQVDGGTMGRLYMHKGNKNMYLGPTYFPTSSLYLQDGTGTVMSITGSSVGIGTTAPETELDIFGPTQDQLRLRTAGSEYYRIGRDSSDGLLYFYGSQTGYTGYVFDGVDGERMRITSAGKVGIGLNPTGFYADQLVVNEGMTLYSTGNSFLCFADGTSGDDRRRGEVRYEHSSNTMAFMTDADTRMVIDSSGQVGIGTTSPERKLHVFKGESGGATSNSDSSLVLENSSNTYLQFLTPTTVESGFLFGDTDNDVGAITYSHNTNSFNFRTAGVSNRMVIDSSGNVGIGTTSPSHKLHVNGDIRQSKIIIRDDSIERYDSTVDNAAVNFNYFGYNTTTDYFRDVLVWNGKNGLVAQFDGSSNNFYVPNGNVGIGTDSPIYKLHVNSSTQAARFTAGDGGYAAVTFDGDAGNTIGALTTHNGIIYIGGLNTGGTGVQGEIRIEPSSGNKLYIASDGNVGINSTGPAYKLDVDGNARFTEQVKVEQPIVGWSDSGTKHYTHLATFSGYGSAASALIINTNIPGHNQSGNANMFSFRIVGYAYGSLGLIDMMVGCYAGENNYYSAWWTGTCQTNWVDNVYVYTNSSGKVAFQIGETTDTLAAEIAITDFVQGFSNVNTSYADSWSCQAVTTLPTQTQKTTLGYKAIAPDIYEDVTFHNSVGIGTTSITKRLEVLAASNTDGIRIQGNSANASLTIQNNGTGGNAWDISSTGAGHGYGNGNLIFGVGFSPKVTFKSDGYILNGGHAANDGVSATLNGWGLTPSGTGTAVCNFSDTNEMFVLNQRDGSGTTQFEFRNGNVERGRIEWTTSGTTYNTNSDYRLKENVTNLTGSLAKVDQLEPKAFNFISDPDEPKIGFIAHEVQDIVPQAVSGIKDAVREDGTPKYQGLDHSMLVPLLVGAIKEQQAIIEDLKARIETLEG